VSPARFEKALPLAACGGHNHPNEGFGDLALGVGAPAVTAASVNLPDSVTVARSVSAWAEVDGQLAALLGAGLTPVEALARWGVQLLKANRFVDSAAALRAAVALAPGSGILWTNLGLALDRGGHLADAAACFESAVSIDGNQPNTWLLLGLVRKRLGDRNGSEESYRAALKLQPDSAIIWQCLGLLKEEQREYAEAIDCFEACARFGPPSAALSANLGKLYYQMGRIAEAHHAYGLALDAEPANSHYAQMRRKTRFLHGLMLGESVGDALATFQASAPSTLTGKSDENVDRLLETTCGQLSNLGHVDVAVQVARKRLELRPDSATAKYILGALLNEPGVTRSPREYIVETFDAFADQFEAKLVGVLDYDVPEKLCAAVRQVAPDVQSYDALDGGCGDGLCGPLLRPIARRLTGLDLSPRMLELAGRRNVYDSLVCEELCVFLGASPAAFDLIVSADVIIYFGDIAPLFSAAATALRQGGLFALSAEHLTGHSYRLQHSGRFAHAPDYVRSVASAHFAQEHSSETTIRLEGRERVRGNLFIFRRR